MILTLGSKGAEVVKLQKRLNELGYKDIGNAMLAEDGSFGAKTEQAVNKFKNAVLPDGNTGDDCGKVGDTTWGYLNTAVPDELLWLPPYEYNDSKAWNTKDVSDFIVFESGQKLQWDGCVPALNSAKSLFETELKKHGWSVRYTSAYRPLIYQAHLYDIKNGPASKTAIGLAHCALHAIKSASYPRRTSSPHILGVAWDCIVVDATGKRLNPDSGVNPQLINVAAACRLKINTPNDNVHFQLVEGAR